MDCYLIKALLGVTVLLAIGIFSPASVVLPILVLTGYTWFILYRAFTDCGVSLTVIPGMFIGRMPGFTEYERWNSEQLFQCYVLSAALYTMLSFYIIYRCLAAE